MLHVTRWPKTFPPAIRSRSGGGLARRQLRHQQPDGLHGYFTGCAGNVAAGNLRLLHLPGECFVAYQLRAQQFVPDCFVATAAWYVPTEEAYPNGGYEVSVAFSDPAIDDQFIQAMRHLLG